GVLRIKNELEEETAPGAVTLQGVVELRGERAQPGQIIPRDGREIVMLVVITHVEADTIDWPVITVGLLVRIVRVMFLDPTCTDRVQANGTSERTKQIKQT